MDEVRLSLQSDETTIQAAFDRLKTVGAAEQQLGCKFIGEHFGAEAEATLRVMLAKAKPKAAPLIQPHRIFRRDLKAPSEAVVETLKRSAVSEPKPEPEPKAIDAPRPNPPAGVLVDMDAPYEVARRFVLDRFHHDGIPTLRWWKAEWRKWTGTHYAAMEEDALRAEIYQFLAKANYGKFDPAPKHVNAVVDAIKAWVLLPTECEVGAWLGEGDAPWGEEPTICCKNGVLRLSDGELWEHDPRLFALNVIETEYKPEAQAPRWTQFLEELWGADEATRNALQEFFGLVLTDETRFQKGFILVGPARSGKGTIARVLMHLLGRANFCGPSLGQLSQTFGMQGLIGKKLAVVPDARLDNRANRSVITEKLLSIIGEDVQDLGSSHLPAKANSTKSLRAMRVRLNPSSLNAASLVTATP